MARRFKGKYYGHFSNTHVTINNRVVIGGLTTLEYFDLKTKKIVKWSKVKSAGERLPRVKTIIIYDEFGEYNEKAIEYVRERVVYGRVE